MAYDDIKKIVEDEVRDRVNDLVKAALDAQREKNMYGVADSPYYHLHTGIDSPTIPFTNLDGAPSTYGTVGQALVVNSNRNGLTFGSGGSTVYTGYVKGDATSASPYFIPSGWTAGLVTHLYTITHNLGTVNYTVVLTAAGATLGIPIIYSIGTNTFTLSIFGVSASLQDQDFTFIVALK